MHTTIPTTTAPYCHWSFLKDLAVNGCCWCSHLFREHGRGIYKGNTCCPVEVLFIDLWCKVQCLRVQWPHKESVLIIKKCECRALDSRAQQTSPWQLTTASKESLLLRGWLEDPLLQPTILVTKLVKEAPAANMGFQDGPMLQHKYNFLE